MTKHVETPSLVLAVNLVAEIDDAEGLPRAAGWYGALCGVSRAAAEAWVANPQGDPPPGVTSTWDIPLAHPSQPARYAVQVTDDLMQRVLVGRQPQGFPGPIQAQHAVERGPEWFGASETSGQARVAPGGPSR